MKCDVRERATPIIADKIHHKLFVIALLLLLYGYDWCLSIYDITFVILIVLIGYDYATCYCL